MTPEARRAELVAAALEVFGRAPYDAVTVAEVAETAGASTALVHHHFGSKRELYRTALRAALDDLLARLRAVDSDELDADQRLARSIGAYLDFAEEHAVGWTEVLRGTVGGQDPAAAEALDATQRVVLDRLRVAMPAGSSVPAAYVDLVLLGYLGFVDRICLAWLDTPDPGKRPPRSVLVATARAVHTAALAAVGGAAAEGRVGGATAEG